MRYKKFEIKNYKGIKNLTLDLDRDPKSKIFTLVGLNESGKTSILEAINLFQENINEKDRHKLIPKNEKLNFNDAVSVAATISLTKNLQEIIDFAKEECKFKDVKISDEIIIMKYYKFTNSNPSERLDFWTIKIEVLKPKTSKYLVLNAEDESWHKITAYIRQKLPSIIYYPNFLFDFPSKIYLDLVTDKDEEQNLTYKQIIQDILSSIDRKMTIEEHIVKRSNSDKNSDKESLEHTLATMGSYVTKLVFSVWSKLFNAGGKRIIVTHGFDERATTKTQYLEFRLEEGANRYAINERSLGFKWFFSFLLFTEIRKKRKTEDGELIFLLDEPASNLHSTAQKNLLKSFEDLVDKSTLIYTTHSHHLINPEWLNGVYIVRNKGIDYTDEFNFDSIKTDVEAIPYKNFVASYPNQREYFQPILDTLEVQPGLLEKIPNIVVLEGKFDYFTFKYINKLFFDNKYENVYFYPGGGASSNFNIIRLYLAWNRNFIILLDGDKAGRDSKKDYEKEFGIEIKDKIFTYSDISKSFNDKSTEDLFEDDEKLSITKYYDEKSKKYEKSRFNTAIQNLLVKNEKIQLSDDTIKRFKEIIDFITEKLE